MDKNKCLTSVNDKENTHVNRCICIAVNTSNENKYLLEKYRDIKIVVTKTGLYNQTEDITPVIVSAFNLACSLLRNCPPIFSQLHHFPSIHKAEAIKLADF